MEAQNKVYFNAPQRLTQLIGANTTVIVAGRRTGKTDSIASPFVLRNMQRMPGSTGGIVVPTFKHGLTNTLPGLFAAWKRWGFAEGIHYVVGRRPPKWFAKPITEPADYEHVISFYNGSVAIIISQDRPGSSNSLTLSWVLVDEAKFIDYKKLKEETLPANGGIKSYFGARAICPKRKRALGSFITRRRWTSNSSTPSKPRSSKFGEQKLGYGSVKKKGNQSPNTCKAISVVSIRTSIK